MTTWATAKGFNFRNTLGYVTDGANEQFVGNTQAYPTTSTIGGDSVTYGWTTTLVNVSARDRVATGDTRLSGGCFGVGGTVSTFRIDLPAAGSYSLRVAMGDQANIQTISYAFRDGATPLLSAVAAVATLFVDASGTNRTAVSWPTDNLPVTVTLAGTVLTLDLGIPASDPTNTGWVAHVQLTQLAPSATKLGVITQPSSTYVSEAAFAQQPAFVLQDAGGATVTGEAATITVAVKSGTGAGSTLVGTLTAAVNTATGIATFANVGVNGWASTTLTATSGALTAVDTTASTSSATRDKKAELPRSVPVTTYPSPITTTYTVGAGKTYATIQAAINAAATADASTHSEIHIDPGTYDEDLVFKKKASGTGWIVLRRAGSHVQPSGTRVHPIDFATGAVKLISSADALNIQCESLANHYMVVGLEITGVHFCLIDLTEAGSTLVSYANMPYDMSFQRCYIHGTAGVASTRAFAVNCRNFSLLDSHVSEIHGNTGDEQALAIASGQVMLVQNNYLSAAGEITMVGGVDTPTAAFTPADITFRGNHYVKLLAWQTTDPVQIAYTAGSWHAKNLFELKNVARCLGENNVMENSIGPGQYALAWAISSVNQGAGAATWSGVRDVTMRFNVVRNMGYAIALSGVNQGPAVAMRRVAIHDNVFAGINTSPYTDVANPVNHCVAIGGGILDMDIVHNTIIGTPGNGTRAITFGIAAGVSACPRTNIDNNIFQAAGSGIQGDGHVYGDALTTYVPDATFTKNVLWEMDPTIVVNFPATSYYPAAVAGVGFVDSTVLGTGVQTRTVGQVLIALTLRLVSAYHLAGSDAKDIGADITALTLAIVGVITAEAAVVTAATSRSRAARLDETGFGVFTNANRWR